MTRFPLAMALAVPVIILGAGCPRDRGAEVQPPLPRPAPGPLPQPEVNALEPGVTVQYYGHACFLVRDSEGMAVAIDPFNESVGYTVPSLTADVCLVTHDHGDHSNVATVSAPSDGGGGPPTVVREPGEAEAAGMAVAGVSAAHHEPGENEARGDIVMFRWEMDGIRLAHLGDLGTDLTQEQMDALGPIDVLMVPVGGYFTIDAGQAINRFNHLQSSRRIGGGFHLTC